MERLFNLKYAKRDFGERIAVLAKFDFGKNWALASTFHKVGSAHGFGYTGEPITIYMFDKNIEMTLEEFFMQKSEIISLTEEEITIDMDDEYIQKE
jgi:hypothetical protein